MFRDDSVRNSAAVKLGAVAADRDPLALAGCPADGKIGGLSDRQNRLAASRTASDFDPVQQSGHSEQVRLLNGQPVGKSRPVLGYRHNIRAGRRRPPRVSRMRSMSSRVVGLASLRW